MIIIEISSFLTIYYGWKKDVSFGLNRVPPPISSRLLLGVPPSLTLRGDVFYGWALTRIKKVKVKMGKLKLTNFTCNASLYLFDISCMCLTLVTISSVAFWKSSIPPWSTWLPQNPPANPAAVTRAKKLRRHRIGLDFLCLVLFVSQHRVHK